MNESNISYELLINRIAKGPITTIYTISNGVNSMCFDSLEERDEYIANNHIPICIRYTIEYYGNIMDKKNIVRELNPGLFNGFDRFISINRRDSYEVIDMEMSKSKNTIVSRVEYKDIEDKLNILSAIAKKIEKEQAIGKQR